MPRLIGNDFGQLSSLMLADRGQREAASQSALQTLLASLSRTQQQQNFEQQRASEQQHYVDALAQQQFQNRRLEAADAERGIDRRDQLDYQNRLLDYYKNKSSQVSPEDLHRQEVEALKVLQQLDKDDQPIPPELVERSGALGRAMLGGISQKRKQQAEEIQLAEEAAEVGNRMEQIKKDAKAIDPTGKDWRAKKMIDRLLPFISRYGPLLDAKAGYVKTDPKTGRLVRAVETPAWMDAEKKAKAQAAKAPFYDRVNALIDAGMSPAEAKARAMSEMSPQ